MDEAPRCYRHPDQPTRITCQRCERPICPECMVPGSVGFQCPECVSSGMRATRQNQLPYGGTRSRDSRITSIVLIAINAVIWGVVLLTGGRFSKAVDYLALSPAPRCERMPDGSFFIQEAGCLANQMDWGFSVATQPWQAITSGFTHIEVMHIGFNMLALFMLGPSMEAVFGRTRFLAMYFVALLGGSAAVMLLSDPFVQTLGASGAIYGLIGALLLVALKNRGNIQNLLIWLGLNVALSFTWPNVSWEGHLGGFLGGAAVAAILLYLPKERRNLQWPLLCVVALVFIAIIGAKAFAWL